MRERRNNTLIIIALVAIIASMGIGFAVLGEQFTLTSESTISKTWNVQITGISKKTSSTGVVESKLDFSSTSAEFNVSLSQPGDYAEYTLTVSNQGGIDAVLTNLTESVEGVDAIKYTVTPATGSTKGSTLAANGTHTFDVRVEYLSTAIGDNAPASGATKKLTLTLDYDVK